MICWLNTETHLLTDVLVYLQNNGLEIVCHNMNQKETHMMIGRWSVGLVVGLGQCISQRACQTGYIVRVRQAVLIAAL